MSRSPLIRARDTADSPTVQPFLMPGNSRKSATNKTIPQQIAPSAEALLIAELRDALVMRDSEIADHAGALTAAYAKGEAAGRSAAEDEFEDSRADALATLEAGLAAAREQFAEALSGFEPLAIAVAVETVEQIFGDAAKHRELMVQAIAIQLDRLRDEAIVAISVSRIDFPDTREIAALSAAVGDRAGTLAARDDLPAGECVIALQLGKVELSSRRHWADIQAALASLSDGERCG